MKDTVQRFPGLIEWSTRYNQFKLIDYVKEILGEKLKLMIITLIKMEFLSSVNFSVSIKFICKEDVSLLSDFAAEDLVSKTRNENKRVLICKQLLTGEVVTIPVKNGCFMLWGAFHDLQTGKEINQDQMIIMRDESFKSEG